MLRSGGCDSGDRRTTDGLLLKLRQASEQPKGTAVAHETPYLAKAAFLPAHYRRAHPARPGQSLTHGFTQAGTAFGLHLTFFFGAQAAESTP
jgi:hypothetical protein